MARALPILIHAETSACPAIGQLRNTLIHDLFRKGARTFCRYLPRMSLSFALRFGPACPAKLVIRAEVRLKQVRPANSLSRHDAKELRGDGESRTLLLDRSREFGRTAKIRDLPSEIQPLLDDRIEARPNIRRDTFANSVGHVRRTRKSRQDRRKQDLDSQPR